MVDAIGTWIQRSMPIEGIATPAFIHNGSTYYFVNVRGLRQLAAARAR